MRILLLHPEDSFPSKMLPGFWDLVVDFGRAPASVYEIWRRAAGCPILSLWDFAEAVEDLQRTRKLLQFGLGRLVDDGGLDWWDIQSVFFVQQLQQIMLTFRLAKHINPVNKECEIYSSGSDYRSTALHTALGGRVTYLTRPFQAGVRRLQSYTKVFAEFDRREILQAVYDKFDKEHAIRRRFTKQGAIADRPSILLPSAYINVSRTALDYAALTPHDQFLLVCARNNAKVQELPANVRMISLDPYFCSPKSGEISSLLKVWAQLKTHLTRVAPEYESAERSGLLNQMPSLIRWGITIRDAWNRIFESQNIRSCFSPDQSNPYTRIPLLLAKHRAIPTLGCHHGALDAWMGIVTEAADFYVAKSEMERDYMTRVCGIARSKVLGVPTAATAGPIVELSSSQNRSRLVFFSEPYNSWSWRIEEVYRELLPRLCALAETCGLKLVFKLHPFETAKGHRKMLLRHLPAEKARQIETITGLISEQLWQETRFALTAQSSVAVECAARSIPVFLCGWLGDSFSGFIQQYQRFGVGHLLESAAQINDIPQLLELWPAKCGARPNHPDPMGAETLRELLAPPLRLPVARQS